MALVLTTAATPSWAGTVSGKIDLPLAKRGKPPVRGKGFLDRLPNPVKETRAYNPGAYMVIYLEGEGAPEAQPTTQRYELIGEGFASPIFAIVAGSQVEIKNAGRTSPQLFVDGSPDALAPEPLNPGGAKTFKMPEGKTAVTLRDRGTPHLMGRIVAFPSRLYSLVDAEGRYSIDDVPPGNWKVRVWYLDGWLDRPDETIEVSKKSVSHDPVIPPALQIKRD